MFVDDVTRAFESGDFARPNLFQVEISYLGQNFTFQCKATALPAGIVEKILSFVPASDFMKNNK